MTGRSYSMHGEDARRAIETGLAGAQWYHSDIDRKTMKALMQRSDGPALRDTALWIGLLIGFAVAAIALWPSWWAALPLFCYGVLYGSAGDSRWHECGHGTAFRTRWMNDVVYQIASFMMVRNPVEWRWSHARHHTDTIIVGRDPEIVFMKPIELLRIALNTVGILDAWHGWRKMLAYAMGRVDAEVADYVPQPEQRRMIRIARIWTAIYGATIAMAIGLGTVLPLMLIGLPRLYGAWHHIVTGLIQHGGLADDVTDHRLNTRTVYMNPVSRFIYWNMNYHIEHHMFPMVPYHALPRLHELVKHDMPAPSPSILAAYREMWPAVKRQLRDEAYFLKRDLPPTAKPYRPELHRMEPAGTG